MTVHLYGAAKVASFILIPATAAFIAVTDPTVKVALIVAIPATITSVGTLILGFLNYMSLGRVNVKVDGMMSKARSDEQVASKEAAKLGGKLEGIASEQARVKDDSKP